jgi:glutamate dehydrogenase
LFFSVFFFSFCFLFVLISVVSDSEGINREELNRLASNRKMVDHFDLSKLSPSGFRVLVTEKNLTLPSGEKV